MGLCPLQNQNLVNRLIDLLETEIFEIAKVLYISLRKEYTEMSFRSRRSFNGVLFVLAIVLITLLVLGIVTGRAIFFVLFGVTLLLIIASVVGLFTFLKKTAAGSPSVRRSTYDISKGKDYTSTTSTKKDQEVRFCETCGMKLEPGVTTCRNCGK